MGKTMVGDWLYGISERDTASGFSGGMPPIRVCGHRGMVGAAPVRVL